MSMNCVQTRSLTLYETLLPWCWIKNCPSWSIWETRTSDGVTLEVKGLWTNMAGSKFTATNQKVKEHHISNKIQCFQGIINGYTCWILKTNICQKTLLLGLLQLPTSPIPQRGTAFQAVGRGHSTDVSVQHVVSQKVTAIFESLPTLVGKETESSLSEVSPLAAILRQTKILWGHLTCSNWGRWQIGQNQL